MIDARAVMGMVAATNARKKDPIPDLLRRQAEASTVKIYNIYNIGWTRSLGSLGQFVIPACDDNGSPKPPDWAPYSKALEIPALIFEYYDRGDAKLAYNTWDGRDVAKDVVGVKGFTPANSLEHWGVFIAAGDTPTKAELATAKKKLVTKMNEVLREGDRLWAGTAKERNNLSDYHRRAATYLNQYRDWNTTPEQLENCEYCGESVRPGIAKCPHCGSILDHEKWERGQAKK